MEVQPDTWTVGKLANLFSSKRLRRRDEYQRGETWTPLQKQRFVDSIFRGYPVPAMFFHAVEEPDPIDETKLGTELYVVDGQQRLTALRDYVEGTLTIPTIDSSSKLKLPAAIREMPAPWAGKKIINVDKQLVIEFKNRKIPIYLVRTNVDEEVRDLFIRLQAGTALSRQQVRDAWPGKLAPFVEGFGGKFRDQPHRLFTLIDKRGDKQPNEDEREKRDMCVGSRQLCAQLLLLFMERERDPGTFPGLGATDLDDLYHEYASFPSEGDTERADRFRKLLDLSADCVEFAVKDSGSSRRVVPKLEVFSVFSFLQAVSASRDVKWDRNLSRKLGGYISKHSARVTAGKRTKSSTIAEYFSVWWQGCLAEIDIPRLDRSRLFSSSQKDEIDGQSNGICGICGKRILPDDEIEYDHIVAHREGGATASSNGRQVHKLCNRPGRPKSC